MTKAEREALELLNEELVRINYRRATPESLTSPAGRALIRAIEERVALRADMAEIDRIAVKNGWNDFCESTHLGKIARIAAKHRAEPDPLVEAVQGIPDEQIRHIAESKDVASCRSRIAEALRGIELARKENNDAR